MSYSSLRLIRQGSVLGVLLRLMHSAGPRIVSNCSWFLALKVFCVLTALDVGSGAPNF